MKQSNKTFATHFPGAVNGDHQNSVNVAHSAHNTCGGTYWTPILYLKYLF